MSAGHNGGAGAAAGQGGSSRDWTDLAGLPDPLPIEPLAAPLDAVVRLPGSKSITNRALVCAALGAGPSVLTGLLDADDTAAMLGVLSSLGVEIERDGDRATVWGCSGRLPRRSATLDVKMSGTTARFALPLAALARDAVTLDGHPAMRARPMADGIAAIEQLGRVVRSADGSLPITVGSDPDLDDDELGGSVTVRGDVSSQFLSGLLLVAPCLRDGLELTVDGPLQSVPYVDMTIAVMRAFGAKVEVAHDRRWFAVEPTGYQQTTYAIEPDASAASYFFAAAALCGGSVTVEGLGAESLQGDVRFTSVLAEMGASVVMQPTSTTVTGAVGRALPGGDRRGDQLRGGRFDLAEISDTAQTLAAIAPFAAAATEVSGIGFIRRKETDRIAAVVTELGRLGVEAEEREDGFRIVPGPVSPGVVQTYDDHRMAMSFAILGLRAPGIEIADPACVAKTFPGFWAVLDEMRGQTRGEVGAVIAIDGPAGSGKSTISRMVAERVGLDMLDTGAMYRAVTCAVLRAGGDPNDADLATAAADDADIVVDRTVTINGDDVTAAIRGPEVSANVSVVAAHSGVRRRLRGLQREWLGRHGGGVVEGRDIGTVVVPDAPLKIYLTASPEVRAMRRAGDAHGDFDLDAAAANIAERDRIDSTRADSPLRPADDAVIVDTSDLTIDQVVDRIVAEATARGLGSTSQETR